MPLVEFADEHWRVEDGGDATFLALLDLSVAFKISIFLDQLQGMGVGSTVFSCSSPFSMAGFSWCWWVRSNQVLGPCIVECFNVGSVPFSL